MSWLDKKIKNDDLLWLVNEILKSFDKGLSIGSYLSQNLGNLYLSDLYHQIECVKHRDKKVVKFQAFYMDDILICGDNSRQLIKVAKLIESEAIKLGLSIKSNWQVVNLDKGFIDMVGFRIYKTHKTVRRRNLKRIRRAYLRFDDSLKKSQRIIAYYGYLKHSNSQNFCHKYNVYQINKKAKGVIFYENKKRCTT